MTGRKSIKVVIAVTVCRSFLIVLPIFFLAFFSFSIHNTKAAITDSQQKKEWFYLQTLSGQVAQIKGCISSTYLDLSQNPQKRKSAWAKYYRLTDELGREARIYIDKYSHKPGTKSAQETPDAFAYRVWSVIFSVSEEKKAELDPTLCAVYLH